MPRQSSDNPSVSQNAKRKYTCKKANQTPKKVIEKVEQAENIEEGFIPLLNIGSGGLVPQCLSRATTSQTDSQAVIRNYDVQLAMSLNTFEAIQNNTFDYQIFLDDIGDILQEGSKLINSIGADYITGAGNSEENNTIYNGEAEAIFNHAAHVIPTVSVNPRYLVVSSYGTYPNNDGDSDEYAD